MQAMQLEVEIRADPFQRADRFVEGWQQLQQHRQDSQRVGDFRGAKLRGEEREQVLMLFTRKGKRAFEADASPDPETSRSGC